MATPYLLDNNRGAPWSGVACRAALTLAVMFTFFRLFFGVSFGDEAVQLSIPYRFLLGDQPLTDEVNLIQTAHFIAYPFYNAYYRLRGSIEGIVLYGRLLYFLLSLAVARIVFLALRPTVGSDAAILISMVVILFVPAAIPNLTYNTLSSLFFTAGTFMFLRGASIRNLAWAGLFHALAIIALQSYLVPVSIFLLLAMWTLENERKTIFAYLIAVTIGLLVFLPAFWNFSFENLKFASKYVGGGAGGLEKIALVFFDLWNSIPRKLLLIPLAGAIAYAWRRRESWMLLLILLVPVLLWRPNGWMSSLYYVFTLGLTGFFFYLPQQKDSAARRLFFNAWIPATVAAFMTAWTSSALSINAGFGMLPGTLVTLALIVIATRELPRPKFLLPRIHTLFIVIVLVTLAAHQTALYREDPIFKLRERISEGPFRGIYTSAEKRSFLTRLTNDLQALTSSDNHVVFYYQFPAGYLLTAMRPAATNSWSISCPPLDLVQCVQEFKRDLGRFNDGSLVLVKLKNLYHNANDIVDWGDGPVDEWIQGRFTRVLADEKYEIYLDR